MTAAEQLKEWRTAQAECLLAGLSAALIEDDTGRPMLVVSKWALCRSFVEVAEVRAWLQRITGKVGV